MHKGIVSILFQLTDKAPWSSTAECERPWRENDLWMSNLIGFPVPFGITLCSSTITTEKCLSYLTDNLVL